MQEARIQEGLQALRRIKYGSSQYNLNFKACIKALEPLDLHMGLSENVGLIFPMK